jgi:hypothetical protein
MAITNLRAKLADQGFSHDIDQLTAQPPIPYDPTAAAELIIARLMSKL